MAITEILIAKNPKASAVEKNVRLLDCRNHNQIKHLKQWPKNRIWISSAQAQYWPLFDCTAISSGIASNRKLRVFSRMRRKCDSIMAAAPRFSSSNSTSSGFFVGSVVARIKITPLRSTYPPAPSAPLSAPGAKVRRRGNLLIVLRPKKTFFDERKTKMGRGGVVCFFFSLYLIVAIFKECFNILHTILWYIVCFLYCYPFADNQERRFMLFLNLRTVGPHYNKRSAPIQLIGAL